MKMNAGMVMIGFLILGFGWGASALALKILFGLMEERAIWRSEAIVREVNFYLLVVLLVMLVGFAARIRDKN